MNKKKNLYHSSGNSGERWYKVTKREAYLSFKCWHCKYLESGSGECLCGETESDECPMPEYDGMTELRNEIEKWQANKMNELKPCPFCGRKPELRRDDDGFSYIVCANDNCYVRTDGHLNDNAAIKAWNRRVGEQNET